MDHPPAAEFLSSWSYHDRTTGIQVDRLHDFDKLEVHTQNSIYEITIISAKTGDVLVRGGNHFPEATPVHFLGASIDGSFLKVRGVYTGFRMEFLHESRRIVTSPVRSVAFACTSLP